MQHGHATIETYNAIMKQYLMIVLHDAHDQSFNYFLTSGMLHASSARGYNHHDSETTPPGLTAAKEGSTRTMLGR